MVEKILIKDLIIIGLTLIGILAAIFIPLYLRQTKKLSYEIMLNTSLIDVNSQVKDEIELYYDNKKVNNPHLIIIRFINDGNQPISVSDFENMIKIIFSEQTKIIQCDSSNSANLKLNYTIESNTITIDPLLINSNENFTFKLIIDGQHSNFRINDRIKGINIKKYSEPLLIAHEWIYLMIGLVFGLLWMYYFTPLFEQSLTAEHLLNKLANLPLYLIPALIIFTVIKSVPDIYRLFRKLKYDEDL